VNGSPKGGGRVANRVEKSSYGARGREEEARAVGVLKREEGGYFLT